MEDSNRQMSISQKIIRNTMYNIVGRIWVGILVGLILTPYIIHHLGVERFGIWAIVGVLTGYFGLLDFGISTSFVKYISKFYTQKDYTMISQVINTGFSFYAIFVVLIIISGFFLINPLLHLFNIPLALHNEARFVFLLAIIIFGVSYALSPFAAVQSGLQRMDISNKVAIVLSIPNIVGTVFFLEMGYGLPGLIVNNAIILVFSSIVNIIIAHKILPELNFSPLLCSREVFKKLWRFGYKLQMSKLASLISFQTDKLLITYFLGIHLVAFYHLGSSILLYIRQIPLLLISGLIPAVAEIDAKDNKKLLIELYLRGSKYLISISTPLLFFVVINAEPIILAWIGKGYEKAVLVIQVLAVGYFMATVTGVASSITAGVAKTELDMKFGILLAILNLFLSIILIINMGFVGVVIGTTVALTIASFFYIKMFHNHFNIPLVVLIQLFYRPISACIIPSLIMVILNYTCYPYIALNNRIINLVLLGVNCLIFGAIYTVIILLYKYFDKYDWDLLKNKLPRIKYLIR
jgi:O-antigen/teichoic acid export membrane protein